MPSTSWWRSGALLAGCCGNTVGIWNTADQPFTQESFVLGSDVVSTLITANLKVMIFSTVDGNVQLYKGEQNMGCLPCVENGINMAPVVCSRLSRDNTCLFVAGGSALYHWDLTANGTLCGVFKEHKSPLTSCAVTDNNLVATASTDGALLLHTAHPHPNTNPITLASAGTHRNAHRCLSFSNLEAGMLCSADQQGVIHLWATASGRSHRLPTKHTGQITGVTFSYGSAHTLLSCGEDKQVLVWDRRAAGGGSAVQQGALSAPASCIALRDDGVSLAVGLTDGSVTLFDARNVSVAVGSVRFSHQRPVMELAWQNAHQQRSSKKGAAPTTASTSTGAAVVHAAAPLATADKLQSSNPAAAGGNSTQASLSTWLPKQLQQPQQPVQPKADSSAQPPAQPTVALAAAQQQDSTGVPARTSGGGSTMPPSQTPLAATQAGSISGRAHGPVTPPPVLLMTPPPSVPLGGAAPTQLPAVQDIASTHAWANADGTVTSPRLHNLESNLATNVATQRRGAVMLSEATFKSYVDEVASGLKEDVRNLHVDLIKQFHIQQVEMTNMVSALMTQNNQLRQQIDALKTQVDRLSRSQALQW